MRLAHTHVNEKQEDCVKTKMKTLDGKLYSLQSRQMNLSGRKTNP